MAGKRLNKFQVRCLSRKWTVFIVKHSPVDLFSIVGDVSNITQSFKSKRSQAIIS